MSASALDGKDAARVGPAAASPRWMKWVLLAAAAYNLAWGALVVAFPQELFRRLGMPEPNYPQIWQCVGMIVGVYGVGYAIAAFDPARHWPIVLVGLLGKLLGPVGFLDAAWRGELPWLFGLVNVTNDLIWLVPFALILAHAYKVQRQ
jgi:small multidrug resistance pump